MNCSVTTRASKQGTSWFSQLQHWWHCLCPWWRPPNQVDVYLEKWILFSRIQCKKMKSSPRRWPLLPFTSRGRFSSSLSVRAASAPGSCPAPPASSSAAGGSDTGRQNLAPDSKVNLHVVSCNFAHAQIHTFIYLDICLYSTYFRMFWILLCISVFMSEIAALQVWLWILRETFSLCLQGFFQILLLPFTIPKRS